MAVESAADRAIFLDVDDFGTAATYTPSGGSAATVNGIFDNDFVEVDAGGGVGVRFSSPVSIAALLTFRPPLKAMPSSLAGELYDPHRAG